MVIVDAQSVKNTDTAHVKGYDAGKKVSGIKRHIAVDTNGLPHAISITAANVQDRAGAIDMIEKKAQRLASVETVLADGGYTGTSFQEEIQTLIQADVEIAKRSELHTFKVIPKRWVVERSFAWLENVVVSGKTVNVLSPHPWLLSTSLLSDSCPPESEIRDGF